MKFITPDHEFLNQGVLPGIRMITADFVPVIQIFPTMEGEGTRVGTPRVFLRLAGCPINCFECDTPESFNVRRHKLMSIVEVSKEVIQTAKDNGIREVSITGGEPMMYPKQLVKLADRFRKAGLLVSLETSGLLVDPEVFRHFDMVSLDIKVPSSKVSVPDEAIEAVARAFAAHSGVQVKCIVWGSDDLEWIEKKLYRFIDPAIRNQRPLVLTPAAYDVKSPVNPEEIENLRAMVMEWNKGYNIVFITQQHKLFGFD